MATPDAAAGPLSIVIFGASGDLTTHKLIPSLYHLFVKGRLSAGTRIVGTARSAFTDDQFRDRLAKSLGKDAGPLWKPASWQEFARQLHYVSGDATKPGGLDNLKAWLNQHEEGGKGDRLYYLSVAPDVYPQIIVRLSEEGMAREDAGWRRVIIEKPFGRDLASARALNRTVHEHLKEEQVYRIDHYLGKETVQNLLVFRFANAIFEPVWNRRYIDHVQITVAEQGTIGSRAGYYDKAGVLRDMFQSHILQVLTLIAMEAPTRYAATPLRNEKVKVLDAIAVPTAEQAAKMVFAGQYQGYHQEPGVAPNSRTPTFAAVRLHIDNWRWQGVPIYLRSGKGLARRYSEVTVQFRCAPHLMFPLPEGHVIHSNRIALNIQPNETIHLHIQTKVPDTMDGIELKPADMHFHFHNEFPNVTIPDAYEILLQDALQGDASLFMRSDEIERAWEIMDPIIAAAERADAPMPEEYAVGSKGPAGVAAFLHEGRRWLEGCK